MPTVREKLLKQLQRPQDWYQERILRIWTCIFLFMLLGVTVSALLHLWRVSSERASDIRQELMQRDLRDLVGRFDSDERFVLAHNLEDVIAEHRSIHPLLLPRQYFVAIPPGTAPFIPRQPPRNCFVFLSEDGAKKKTDRFCSYFTDNKSLGKYLFLNASFEDRELVPHRLGGNKFATDFIKLKFQFNGQKVLWLLTFQPSPYSLRNDRFEITAFREVDGAHWDRDKKIEGWAYLQPQVGGKQVVNLIARMDFKEFEQQADEDVWPPTNWRNAGFSLERQDADANALKKDLYHYEVTGATELSVASLGAQIFSSYGNVTVDEQTDSGLKSWIVRPPSATRIGEGKTLFGMRLAGGDLLIPSSSRGKSEPVPDTQLMINVSHPWTVVEKGFWQISLYLIALLVGGFLAAAFFAKRLLNPIIAWSKESEALAGIRNDQSVEFRYGERNDEIGTLARAINALIHSVRVQTVEAHAEREAREAETRRREAEEIRNREQNLKVIGHEIRSPLQALMSLHANATDPSRRYLDRMVAALPHLLGGLATADAIGARNFSARSLDMGAFLTEIARNALQIDIPDVVFQGPAAGVYCKVDDGAIEDVVSNLLNNAHRHRTAGTAIQITLRVDGGTALIDIGNEGPHIPEDALEQIFDFGYSTAAPSSAAGQGVGLFVVRSYISKMGGTITAHNEGNGVVFRIMLPVEPAVPA